jgi:hypothetical protein
LNTNFTKEKKEEQGHVLWHGENSPQMKTKMVKEKLSQNR